MMRPPEHQPAAVVLPQVIVNIQDSGEAQVTVDGVEHPGGRVDRGQLGSVLAHIAEAAERPIRVEIHESDGTLYADILDPPRPMRREESQSARAPVLYARGFTAGETVLVAVLAESVRAEADGTVCLLDEPATPRHAQELILLGTQSRRTVRARATIAEKPRRWWR
jgi:hypothetical protein